MPINHTPTTQFRKTTILKKQKKKLTSKEIERDIVMKSLLHPHYTNNKIGNQQQQKHQTTITISSSPHAPIHVQCQTSQLVFRSFSGPMIATVQAVLIDTKLEEYAATRVFQSTANAADIRRSQRFISISDSTTISIRLARVLFAIDSCVLGRRCNFTD
jgi:hypothetical protein